MIIVAFPKADNGKNIKNILVRSGFRVVAVCTNAAQVIQESSGLEYGIVVCPYRLPDMMYWELKEYLPPEFEMVVLMSKGQGEEVTGDGILSLSMPLKVHDLVATIEMVTYSLERKKRRRRNVPRKRSQEEQDIINKAKSILIERNNMTEEEAHRYLQKTSMDNGVSFTETAQMIISMMDV